MKKGFTFIELVLLVICVSTIGAIAVPKVNGLTELADQNSCRRNMMILATGESMYFCKFNEWGAIVNLDASGVLEHASFYFCPSPGAGGACYIYSECAGTYSIACPYLPGSLPDDHGTITTNYPSWY